MKRNLVLITASLLTILAVTLLLDQRRSADVPLSDHPEVVTVRESVAPGFSFQDLKGKPRSLHDFSGKVVLLNFWASWCAPCVVEFPKLNELAQANPDRLVIIAGSVDTDRQAIEKFLHKTGLRPAKNLHIFHDVDRAVSQDIFQTVQFPETIIISPDGRMVRKVLGDTDWTGEAMRSYLSGLAPVQAIP